MSVFLNSNNSIPSMITSASSVRREPDWVSSDKVQDIENGSALDEPQLSLLARQLNAAAERAAARDTLLSRKELAELASRIRDNIGGERYLFSKEFYDTQRPETEDAEWLARAQQATDFVNGKGSNPFRGLSREQLALITYDESGLFTVNERRAASMETEAQQFEWAKYIIGKMDVERLQTGRNVQALYETLDYYNALPRIEVAGYGNYEASIRASIALQEVEVEWPDFNITLVDLIANEWASIEDLLAQDEGAAAADLDPKGTA